MKDRSPGGERLLVVYGRVTDNDPEMLRASFGEETRS